MRAFFTIFRIIIILVCIPAAFAEEQPQPALRPNIVFIMLDDMDYDDVGVYGSPDIKTPNFDALAAAGMRFTDYYTNSPVCSPTRASILTGEYPARFGIDRILTVNSHRGIPADAPSVARVLKSADYRTGHIGKWHVGSEKLEFLPSRKGFDDVVRYVKRFRSRAYTEFKLSYNDWRAVRYMSKQHMTEQLTDEALRFIVDTKQKDPDKPFFLNLWYHAPHEPLQVPSNFDNSTTHYCIDYDLDHVHCKSPRGNFAALVTNADQQVGRILKLLNVMGLAKDTLVIVTSDNGGVVSTHSQALLPNRRLNGYKTDVFEGGVRVPFIARWPRVIPAGTVNKSVIASFDLLPTFADIVGADVDRLNLDGESFYNVLQKNTVQTRKRPLIWDTKLYDRYFVNASGIPDTYAVRDGDWKLVYLPADRVQGPDNTMLFNIKKDPAEQHDLLAANAPSHRFQQRLIKTRAGGTAPHLSSTRAYPMIAEKLQAKFYQWRRDVGDIRYPLVPSKSGVAVTDNVLTFSGGAVTVARDTRFDFNDGSFSFLTRIKPFETHGVSVIAQKTGSWQLLIDNGELKLIAYGPLYTPDTAPAHQLILSSPIRQGRAYHVAFTAMGWGLNGGESELRLFVNGELVDESVHGKSIKAVKSQDVRSRPMIYIGNNRAGTLPFYGEIRQPRMSVLSLYPQEVRSDYEGIVGRVPPEVLSSNSPATPDNQHFLR